MANSEVLGIGEMRAAFARVKNGMETRTGRLMVVAAGGVLKRKAKAIAQANGSVRTGAMVKNIAIKREPQAPAGTVQYNMAVRSGADLTKKQKSNSRLGVTAGGRIVKNYVDNPYYWRFVERGHKIVGRSEGGEKSFTTTTYTQRLRNGKTVVRTKDRATNSMRARRAAASGMVPAKPFLGPALEQGKEEAIAAMGTRLEKELARQAAP